MRDLLPLFALVGTAVAIWILRARHRRRHEVNPPAPHITIAEAWDIFRSGRGHHPDGVFSAPGETPPENVIDALAPVEHRVLASDYPRGALRSAILEIATLSLHLDAISRLEEAGRERLLKGYTAGMDAALGEGLRACRAQSMALRWFGHMRFDDAVPGDWFHHYLRAAGPYVREKVRFAREHLVEMNEGAARFAEVYDKLLDELAREALAAPPKKRFPPSDLPA